MADATKILGQQAPSANTLTTLYTVPGATSTVLSSITICNQTSQSIRFRISVAVAGAADATQQYIYYDELVPPNDTFIATVGLTLATTDVVRCYTSATGVSFNAFGVEVT